MDKICNEIKSKVLAIIHTFKRKICSLVSNAIEIVHSFFKSKQEKEAEQMALILKQNEENKISIIKQASEIVLQKTVVELDTYKRNTLKELFGIETIEQFNSIPNNSVRIVNGKVEYNEEVVCNLFAGYLAGNLAELDYTSTAGGFIYFIKSLFHIIRNIRVININEKIIKKNKAVEEKYILPNAPQNAYKELSKKGQELIDHLQKIEADEINEMVEYSGGEKNFLEEITTSYLPQCIKNFNEDMEPIYKLIKERNNLLKH